MKETSGDFKKTKMEILVCDDETYIRNETHFKVESQAETYYDGPRNPITRILVMSNRTHHDY